MPFQTPKTAFGRTLLDATNTPKPVKPVKSKAKPPRDLRSKNAPPIAKRLMMPGKAGGR